jgi:hypothetical protein
VSEKILLANSALSNFYREAQISSLDGAILLHQNALHLRAAPHVQRSASLRGLGLAFAERFHLTGKLQDLHEAISLLRQAFCVLPTPDAAILHDLLAALLTKFGKKKDIQDLRDAMSLYAQAQGQVLLGSGSTMKAAESNHEPQLDVRTTHHQHYICYLKAFPRRDPRRLHGMRLPCLEKKKQYTWATLL